MIRKLSLLAVIGLLVALIAAVSPVPAQAAGTSTFSNFTYLTIPDQGAASVYPSTITVSGMTGVISHVTVTLTDLNHTFPDDLDILLVGPGGGRLCC